MRSGFLPSRVVHLHPTRACNLACLHCYSDSSPRARMSLDADLVLDALRELRREGYEVLSLSGGEPLVYRQLGRLVRGASGLGYRVHLVTNGLLLTRSRLAELREYVGLVAVSLDGAEAVHNRVRGRQDAFARAETALEVLAASDVPFGLAFGVSRRSLPDVPWAFERARALGAGLLHLRPLVPEGRGTDLADEWMLSPDDTTRLALLGQILDSGPAATPRVQVDLVSVAELAAAREEFDLGLAGPAPAVLSDAVNPLVIDERGRLLAFTYGIHPSYQIARLSPGWTDELRRFRASAGCVAHLLRAAFRGAVTEPVEYLDWFAYLTRVSHRIPAAREPAGSSAGHPYLEHEGARA